MTDATPMRFRYEDDPDAPGWMRWSLSDPTLYNGFLGPLSVRLDGEIARVRMTPERRHANLRGHVHGGALLGFMDVSLFAASRAFDVLHVGAAATVDLSAQFLAGASLDEPVEARIELLRETGRLLFLRGLVVQEAGAVASFSGTVRKPSTR
ncbi:MAG: PaaI family thioesterase [Pseudomonadota bacterium]